MWSSLQEDCILLMEGGALDGELPHPCTASAAAAAAAAAVVVGAAFCTYEALYHKTHRITAGWSVLDCESTQEKGDGATTPLLLYVIG